jgi:hypothetical protein
MNESTPTLDDILTELKAANAHLKHIANWIAFMGLMVLLSIIIAACNALLSV